MYEHRSCTNPRERLPFFATLYNFLANFFEASGCEMGLRNRILSSHGTLSTLPSSSSAASDLRFSFFSFPILNPRVYCRMGMANRSNQVDFAKSVGYEK